VKYRLEKDSIGPVKVPIDKYWGAQTQRSTQNFKIGGQQIPTEIIQAYAILKKAAALTNLKTINFEDDNAKQQFEDKVDLIVKACEEILEGNLDAEFPLVVWQTGSGTQTNMNVNEVVANRAHVLNGGALTDEKKLVHPNDDVNKSQSSNDTFPTAMHIAAYKLLAENTLPNLKSLKDAFEKKATEFESVIKIGRTHFMDATPISLGQEFSGYVSQLAHGIKAIEYSLDHLSELALGGTAVGTGINTPPGYAVAVAEKIAKLTGLPFKTAW